MGNVCGGSKEAQADRAAAAYAPSSPAGSGARGGAAAVRALPVPHAGRALQALCDAGAGRLLTGGEDRSVLLLDWQKGAPVCRWTGHTGNVTRVAFCAESQLALSGARDQLVHLWRLDAPAAPAATLRGHTLTISGLAASEPHGRIATGSRDYSVRLWDLETGAQVDSRSISRNVVTWIPGEALVAQASEDLTIRVWDVRTMEVAQTLQGHVNLPLCVDAHGALLLSCSNGFDGAGCEARLWDRRRAGAELQREFAGHSQSVNACAFLPSAAGAATHFATGSTDRTVRVWRADGEEGEAWMDSFDEGGTRSGPVTALVRVTTQEGGAAFAAGNYDGALRVWGVDGGGGGAGATLLAATPAGKEEE